MNQAREEFEKLTQKYTYHENDMDLVQDIALAIQGNINTSKVYDSNEKLQQINDGLLSL